jgi:hypothetical protein
MKIRAAVLNQMQIPQPYATTRPISIETIELDPPGPGEVLVKIAAAGLCHSDLSVIDGNRQRPLRTFDDLARHPLLDFETINPAIPLFEGTRPYQIIPFQFSLHVLAGPGAEPVHSEFLAEAPDDPRPALLDALRRIGPDGTVLAYNMAFEKRVHGPPWIRP